MPYAFISLYLHRKMNAAPINDATFIDFETKIDAILDLFVHLTNEEIPKKIPFLQEQLTQITLQLDEFTNKDLTENTRLHKKRLINRIESFHTIFELSSKLTRDLTETKSNFELLHGSYTDLTTELGILIEKDKQEKNPDVSSLENKIQSQAEKLEHLAPIDNNQKKIIEGLNKEKQQLMRENEELRIQLQQEKYYTSKINERLKEINARRDAAKAKKAAEAQANPFATFANGLANPTGAKSQGNPFGTFNPYAAYGR